MSIELRRAVMAAMSITTPLVLGATSPALAQGLRPGEAPLEELIVTGVRGEARSVTDSTVPIDVLERTSSRTRATPISATCSGTWCRRITSIRSRSATPPRSCVLPTCGVCPGPHTGPDQRQTPSPRRRDLLARQRRVRRCQGPTFGSPLSALKRVELFATAHRPSTAPTRSPRDDVLLNMPIRAHISRPATVRTSRDGDQYAVSGNIGLPLTSNGCANQLRIPRADPTDRSVQRDDAATLVAAGNTAVKSSPDQRHAQGPGRSPIFGNLGVDLSESLKLYGHGNYVSKTAIGGCTIATDSRAAVYSADEGETLLIGD